jgi:hypothetical protein
MWQAWYNKGEKKLESLLMLLEVEFMNSIPTEMYWLLSWQLQHRFWWGISWEKSNVIPNLTSELKGRQLEQTVMYTSSQPCSEYLWYTSNRRRSADIEIVNMFPHRHRHGFALMRLMLNKELCYGLGKTFLSWFSVAGGITIMCVPLSVCFIS